MYIDVCTYVKYICMPYTVILKGGLRNSIANHAGPFITGSSQILNPNKMQGSKGQNREEFWVWDSGCAG